MLNNAIIGALLLTNYNIFILPRPLYVTLPIFLIGAL